MITLTTDEALAIRNWLWQLAGYVGSTDEQLAQAVLDLGDQMQAKIQDEALEALNNE